MCAALVTSVACGACSVAVPMGAQPAWRATAASAEDVTGTIPQKPTTLSAALEPEDWRRASAAINTALDPQGSGAGVNWDNPQTGARGSVTPVGQAFPVNEKVCRNFKAEIITKQGRELLDGGACREKSAEWTLTTVTRRKA